MSLDNPIPISNKQDEVIVTFRFNMRTFKLDVAVSDDKCNINVMQCIIQQAKRYFDKEEEKMAVLALQHQMTEMNEGANVRELLSRQRGRQ